jgi:hypothetical protein
MSEGRFRFLHATPDDEPEIRALVGSLVMPGTVSVRFEREPDYFLGTTIQGRPCDVLIARHLPDDELAGVMVRAERRVYLDGREARVAYIGQIRIAPRYQGHWLMQRAAAEAVRLRDRSLPYVGVIASDNPVARGTIAGRRPPGSATVERIARLRSLAFVVHRRSGPRRTRLPVTAAQPETLETVADFMRFHGPSRQLFPVVDTEDLLDGVSYRGLRPRDLMIAWRDGDVAGILGSWDQSAYKQEILAHSGPRLRRLRPAYDLLARAIGAHSLPRPGEPIRTAFGCLRCTADDDPDVLGALLRAARARARRQGQAFLLVGFDAAEPLARTLGRPLAVTYESDVYLGSFPGDGTPLRLDGRPVHVEVGTL